MRHPNLVCFLHDQGGGGVVNETRYKQTKKLVMIASKHIPNMMAVSVPCKIAFAILGASIKSFDYWSPRSAVAALLQIKPGAYNLAFIAPTVSLLNHSVALRRLKVILFTELKHSVHGVSISLITCHQITDSTESPGGSPEEGMVDDLRLSTSKQLGVVATVLRSRWSWFSLADVASRSFVFRHNRKMVT